MLGPLLSKLGPRLLSKLGPLSKLGLLDRLELPGERCLGRPNASSDPLLNGLSRSSRMRASTPLCNTGGPLRAAWNTSPLLDLLPRLNDLLKDLDLLPCDRKLLDLDRLRKRRWGGGVNDPRLVNGILSRLRDRLTGDLLNRLCGDLLSRLLGDLLNRLGDLLNCLGDLLILLGDLLSLLSWLNDLLGGTILLSCLPRDLAGLLDLCMALSLLSEPCLLRDLLRLGDLLRLCLSS
jgi:hypothetical protein